MSLNLSAEMTPGQALLLAVAQEMRPELHRYCARLVGSVIDGEDVVQDTFAKILSLEESEMIVSPRGWIFRTAHNRALDLLRNRAIRNSQPLSAALDVIDGNALDPAEQLLRREAISTAVSRFVLLPVTQRAVVILKDVLDEPLSEIASTIDLTVDAVKAHLARGRAALRTINESVEDPPTLRLDSRYPRPSQEVARYVSLFNQRDWTGLRALLARDVQLNQATHPPRRGASDVTMFFGTYAKIERIWLRPAWLEGREVVAVYETREHIRPAYFQWLEWTDGRIATIRDYRYVRYILDGAQLRFATPNTARDKGY